MTDLDTAAAVDDRQQLRSVFVPRDVLAFLRVMLEVDALPDGAAYFLERPTKWLPEFTRWRELGKPTDASDEGWSEWLAAV